MWWEHVRRQLNEDVCRGTYEPFASLPRTVVANIIHKLSDEDIVRLALVSKSTRGQLLADACLCQRQLVGYQNSARKFASYIKTLKALRESNPTIKLADCLTEEHTPVSVKKTKLNSVMGNTWKLFRMYRQCQVYFWFRPTYCELFNRYVLLTRAVREFFAEDDISCQEIKNNYDKVVDLADQIDRRRGQNDWQYFQPIENVDSSIASSIDLFLQHYRSLP